MKRYFGDMHLCCDECMYMIIVVSINIFSNDINIHDEDPHKIYTSPLFFSYTYISVGS